MTVRALDPAPGADEELWAQMLALQIAERDERVDQRSEREFRRRRQAELRALFGELGGGWYVALDEPGGGVLAGCGLVVRGGRVSIQAVDTAEAHRRQGICSRLLVDAVHDLAARAPISRVLIGADPGYHALGLYESLGFAPIEHVASVCRMPPRDPGG